MKPTQQNEGLFVLPLLRNNALLFSSLAVVPQFGVTFGAGCASYLL
jgi:hypothetical protein